MEVRRRTLVAGLPGLLAACTSPSGLRAVDLRRINPAFLRREAAHPRDDEPGCIVVDTAARCAALRQRVPAGTQVTILPTEQREA